MSNIVVVKERVGVRQYQVQCEQHGYKSPVVAIFDNAEDLDYAHRKIAHGNIRKTTSRRYGRA